MYTAIEGVYENGTVALNEALPTHQKTKVLIMFMQETPAPLMPHIPLFEHHRDPFDRLLLATSLSENLPIISADENFRFYTPQIQLIEN